MTDFLERVSASKYFGVERNDARHLRRGHHRGSRGMAKMRCYLAKISLNHASEKRADWRRLVPATLLTLSFVATATHAAITVNKTFTPATVTVGDMSTATVTLGNTGATAATNAAFTDTLPSGLVIATPSNAATTCGGALTATSGAGSFRVRRHDRREWRIVRRDGVGDEHNDEQLHEYDSDRRSHNFAG